MTFTVTAPTQLQCEEHKDEVVDLNLDVPWNPSEHSNDPTQMFRTLMMQKLNKKEAAMLNEDCAQPLVLKLSEGAKDSDNEELIMGMPELLKPEDSDGNDSDDKASIVTSARLKETFHDCKDSIGWNNGEANNQPLGQQEGVRSTNATDTGNVVQLNVVADSEGTHYFNSMDKADPSEGLGSIHELQNHAL